MILVYIYRAVTVTCPLNLSWFLLLETVHLSLLLNSPEAACIPKVICRPASCSLAFFNRSYIYNYKAIRPWFFYIISYELPNCLPGYITDMQIICVVRKHLMTGGTRRLPFTVPPLVFSALRVYLFFPL